MSAGDACVASLPMYDWPEIKQANDALWVCLRDSLRTFGFPAPDNLCRKGDACHWTDPGLVLGQTCGLPFTNRLRQHVSIVGTPAYDIDCGAGCYYSVIVVHRDNEAHDLTDLRGARVAYNSEESLSGYAALCHRLKELTAGERFFGDALRTGSHRASVQTVAEGKAGVAAIDAVSWRLALRHEALARDLRVIEKTDPLPGLPFICARRSEWRVERLHLAVVEAMAALDGRCADALLLTGFAQTDEADYAPIRQRARLAAERPL